MPVTLNGLNSTPRSDTTNGLYSRGLSQTTIGAGVTNATVQNVTIFGMNFKIRYVAVYFSAIDNITGTDSFNLVVGTGAYTSGPATLGTNDNSFDPSSTTQVGVANVISPVILGGVGYPTNVATPGTTVFGTDVALNAANFPNIATGTGGYALLTVPNYDVVYPGNIPITLRATTVASTGSITGLTVTLVCSNVRRRPAPPGSEAVAPQPIIDF